MLLTHDEFPDAFQGKREVSPQDCLVIAKVNYRTVYREKVFPLPSVCLLASEKVVTELLHSQGVLNFFLCFRSELATEVVPHGTIRLDSKIR